MYKKFCSASAPVVGFRFFKNTKKHYAQLHRAISININ